jgi:uncharacterized protein (TIGR03083 family)
MATEAQLREPAQTHAKTAAEGFRAAAGLYRSLSGEEWNGPTGCAHWNMRRLAGHTIGEAVWFPHLVLEVTRGVSALPASIWDELAALPGDELAVRIDRAAGNLVGEIAEVSDADLEKPADLGWTTMPLGQAMYVAMFEGVLHEWDGRARRESNATIPTPWAVQMARCIDQMVPALVHRASLAGGEGEYLLQVGDGIGSVLLHVTNDGVVLGSGDDSTAAITIELSADGYVRLLTGRYPLRQAIGRGEVRVQGSEEKVNALNRVFGGVANG